MNSRWKNGREWKRRIGIWRDRREWSENERMNFRRI